MGKWNKTDWAEAGIIFLFLVGSGIALAIVGALMGEAIIRIFGV